MTQQDDEDFEAYDVPTRPKDDPTARLALYTEDLDEYDDDDDSDDDDDDSDDDDDDSDDDDSDDDESDDDDDDDESDDDDDDDFDDLDDAQDEDIDLVIAIYREDGLPVAAPLAKDFANDLDDVIEQLRRLPADAGAIGMISLVEEVFLIVRVRGSNVQVLLSDGAAAGDWPIARDVADFLGVEDIPDPDDDSEPMGDLGLLTDLGVSEFDMTAFCNNFDDDSDEILGQIAERVKVGPAFRKAADSF